MQAPWTVPIPEAFRDLLQTQLLLQGCGQTAAGWSGQSPLSLCIQSRQETGPGKNSRCTASGRPRKSQERRAGTRRRGDRPEGVVAGGGGTEAHLRPPISSLVHILQDPERGLHTEKNIRDHGVFCLFSFKINGSASGLLEKGRGASHPICAVVTSPHLASE